MDEVRFVKNKKALRGYFKRNNLVLAEKAMDYAELYHVNKRKNGAPEFGHQVFIASYAVQVFIENIRYPDEFLAAVFLHDTVEDYPDKVSFLDIYENFNSVVVDILKPVTKKASFSKSKEDYEEYYSGIVKIPLSVMVKAADRIHNLQTMVNVFTIEKQYQYINEVETFILPMLKIARKDFYEYEQVFLALSHTLERQITYLKEILKRDEEIISLKAQLKRSTIS